MTLSSNDHCLCGVMHVRSGTLLIGVFYLTFGCIATVAEHGRLFAVDLAALAVMVLGACTACGADKNKHQLLMPLMIVLVISNIAFIISVPLLGIFILSPNLFFENKVSESQETEFRQIGVVADFVIFLLLLKGLWFLSTLNAEFKDLPMICNVPI
ncbi:hypothetical protein QR680_015897 [Steinernema hermaphroditum]|uniref:Uncharacterized protein n=1 Tax=Steinernema hermaphroditum TaxID=289476 RepID=A0AA39HB81_9BILA|nr:hypothetical protein QR680_015897 [Steinernema hermaphroditum]